MRTFRKSGVTALTAAIALSLGGIPAAFTATSILADGGGTTTLESATTANPDYVSIGNLSLSTAATAGSITRFDESGDPVGTAQTLSPGRNCLLTTDGSLLGITGNFTGASFANGSIGVAEKKSGQSCSQVGAPNEVLTLTLNPSVKGWGNPAFIESAALDIEAKQSARIVATAWIGQEKVGDFELQSGATQGTPSEVGGAIVFPCNAAADSGPDSGASDNCRWPIERNGLRFTSLTLEAKNGSFSLEGGADGPGTEPSVFQLVQRADGTLKCPTTTSTDGTESIVQALDGDKPEVRVRRIGNADASTCESLPYTLAHGSGLATFYKPLNIETRAQFIVSLIWRFPAQPYTTIPATTKTPAYQKPAPADLPATTIDFEVPGEPEAVAMGWCVDPKFSTPDRLEGINNPLSAPDMEPNLPETQHACIGTRVAKSVKGTDGKDYYEVSEQIYLLGDARFVS
jgi:hypothetical protein